MNRLSSISHTFLRRCGAPLLLAFFGLALYSRLLFTNRVLAEGDILRYFYPYRDYASAVLRSGHLPLWNPYIFLGTPFLANPQAAVLYPFHWLLLWFSVTQQIYWSAALHTWLLGLGGYYLLRHWKLGVWASLTGGIVLAGSGFYGGMLGHINQMEGAAWLPWVVLVLETGDRRPETGDRRPETGDRSRQSLVSGLWSLISGTLLFALLVALMLLAGHTQTAYINLFGVGVWAAWPGLVALWKLKQQAWREAFAIWWPRLSIYSLGVLLGVLLSAAQLLPTMELSNLGLRHGGLSYAEASSFSLKLTRLPFTLLPTYGLVDLGVIFDTSGYTEFVAYVGGLGLLLALLGAWKGRGAVRIFGLLFAGIGLFLAIGRWDPLYFVFYKIIPGFNLFRTPARWMMLYTLGMAALAAVGVEWLVTGNWRLEIGEQGLTRRLSGLWSLVSGLFTQPLAPCSLLLLVALDLILAARALPHTQPTAPQAVYDVRTAPAHLLTDPVRTALGPAAMGRFLSMSPIGFDPGDAPDFRRIFRERTPATLDARAFNQLVIAFKLQEILAPNLSLLWRVPAVDGYDGGVLPLQRYIDFLKLLIPPDKLVPDGRLSEQLKEMPRTDLLNLLNVQYLMTDKVRDLWFQDVYYDRQIGARLRPAGPAQVQLEIPQPFAATHLGLIGYVEGDAQALQALQHQTIPVAEMVVQPSAGKAEHFTLTAGGQTGANLADGTLDSPLAKQNGIPVAYKDVDGKHQEYLVKLALPQPTQPLSITVQRLNTPLTVVVQAVTLIDARTGMFTPLLPSDRGRFRLVHSGDVKLYENLDVLPRAYLTYQVLAAKSPDEALTLLQSGQATAPQTSVVEGLASFTSQADAADQAQLVAYTPESVKIQTRNATRALLVLSDSFYPGWSATLDGEATPIYPTNYLFRGVALPPGEHTVVFAYQPASWQRGLWLSGFGLLLCLTLLCLAWRLKIPQRSY
ncbi:MAG: YfhO family protein [Caldilineaceae bacterium]